MDLSDGVRTVLCMATKTSEDAAVRHEDETTEGVGTAEQAVDSTRDASAATAEGATAEFPPTRDRKSTRLNSSH